MPRKWREKSNLLIWQACDKALCHKWRRGDVKSFIEEWTGRSRWEMMEDETTHGSLTAGLKMEILDEIALAMEDMVDGILHGVDPDFDPVEVEHRPDGNTGKIRNIATLCIRHQILGHIVYKGIEPLVNARILPTQHASIPGRGQTGLARQVKRFLNRKSLGINKCIKTDCTGAYASVTYELCGRLIREEIPRAGWIHRCMEVLGRYAPGGHLIIGGYIDAWLFNFVMSYAVRYVIGLRTWRRGNGIPMVIRAVTFMDDMALMGRNRKALLKAVEQAREWMARELGLMLRTTTGVTELMSIPEEKERKRNKGARRGCPAIDMGGYLIHRTYITVRKRNVPKIIRCARRAESEIRKYGSLRRQRAGQIISRYGMMIQSDCYRFIQRYGYIPLMRKARKNQGYWERIHAEKRRERIIHAAERYTVNCKALCYPY